MKRKCSAMKTGGLLAALCFLYFHAGSMPTDTLNFERLLLDFSFEMQKADLTHCQKQKEFAARLVSLDLEIAYSAGHKRRRHCRALETKLKLLDEMAATEMVWESNTLKVRYRKGIDLIKLMYEKILGLDHHFTGLHTYQNISALSNPNSFPEFQQAKELMTEKKNKRFGMNLPAVLQTNPYIAATYTLVSVLVGDKSQQKKEEEFEKIACILDFTVRMNADLNIIRHETEFLRNSNQTLKEECERLFQEYTKAVGYFVPLETVRNEDDWESLYHQLDEMMGGIQLEMEENEDAAMSPNRQLVTIEFATQRVAEFIGRYTAFIGQGTQYYQKFDNIISTYQNQAICAEKLPRQFGDLQKDIKSTIEKFNHTYNLPELQGSRLKALMYGSND